MVGSAVAIIVESRFCMNIAVATISAVSRVRCVTRLGSSLVAPSCPIVGGGGGGKDRP